MCGIYCCLCVRHSCGGMLDNSPEWKSLLEDRGPNSSCHFKPDEGRPNLEFFGSVLWHQGSEPTHQPCEDSDGNVLLWNGDVFSGLEIPPGTSDTEAVLNLLQKAGSTEIPEIFESIQGPGAFIYYQKSSKTLWFGRDWCGRRSLILSAVSCTDESLHFIISSVCPSARTISQSGSILKLAIELPASSVYSINLENQLPLEISAFSANFSLEKSSLVKWNHVQTSLWQNFCPLNREIRHFTLETPLEPPPAKFLRGLLGKELSESAEKLLTLLKEAVTVRTSTTIDYCRQCLPTRSDCRHCRVGVLFSGGLDSTVLAAISHLCLPVDQPIDLFNVAFVKNRKDGPTVAPDRMTGHQALQELCDTFPERDWNFVEIDVDKEELEEKREERIRDLIHPSKSVLDDSIGCALWFAARGKGTKFSTSSTKEPYTSTARVVILGMGADEQLAGYVRHRRLYNKKPDSFEAINDELSLEMARIGIRNLGRDNRVVADHGREARYPFLDENVHSFLNSLPLHLKLIPGLPVGIGDKIVLRYLASEFLNLKKTSLEPKRAIQFGSRIAKLENSGEKGGDVCERL